MARLRISADPPHLNLDLFTLFLAHAFRLITSTVCRASVAGPHLCRDRASNAEYWPLPCPPPSTYGHEDAKIPLADHCVPRHRLLLFVATIASQRQQEAVSLEERKILHAALAEVDLVRGFRSLGRRFFASRFPVCGECSLRLCSFFSRAVFVFQLANRRFCAGVSTGAIVCRIDSKTSHVLGTGKMIAYSVPSLKRTLSSRGLLFNLNCGNEACCPPF